MISCLEGSWRMCIQTVDSRSGWRGARRISQSLPGTTGVPCKQVGHGWWELSNYLVASPRKILSDHYYCKIICQGDGFTKGHRLPTCSLPMYQVRRSKLQNPAVWCCIVIEHDLRAFSVWMKMFEEKIHK